MEKTKKCIIGFVVLVSALTLMGCNQPIDTPDTPATVIDGQKIGLRGNVDEIDGSLFVSVWGAGAGDSLLLTEGVKKGNRYVLHESIDPLSEEAYVSIVYPDSLYRSKHYVMVSHSSQDEVYYFGSPLSVGTKDVSVELRRVQSKLNFNIDLSSFSPQSTLEELALYALYEYGWINLMKGSFEAVDGNYDHQNPVRKFIKSTIGSIVDGKGCYQQSFYTIPVAQQELMLRATIDGRDYVASLPPQDLVPGADYKCNVMIMNKYNPVELTEAEKESGRGDNPTINQPSFPDYEYTITSSYHKSLSNGHGALFEFWVDSRIDQSRDLEYKLLIRDKNQNIVSSSPIFGGLTVKAYHYEGFRVPVYIDVPSSGRYTYQLLLRNKGEQSFYEPAQRGDDLPSDKEIEIHDKQDVFVSSFQIGDANKGSSSITPLELNKNYQVRLSLSNYSSSQENVTIRLYHRRNPLEGHGNLGEVLDEKPIVSWQDKIGEIHTSISGRSSKTFKIPFVISQARPTVKRFPSYICATVEYNGNGVELPLLKDGTLIYKYSHAQYNPNPYIDGSGVYNLAYVEVK